MQESALQCSSPQCASSMLFGKLGAEVYRSFSYPHGLLRLEAHAFIDRVEQSRKDTRFRAYDGSIQAVARSRALGCGASAETDSEASKRRGVNDEATRPTPLPGLRPAVWSLCRGLLGRAARKVIQYAARKVIQSEGGSFYVVPCSS